MEILKFGCGERIEVSQRALERRFSGRESGFSRLVILPIPTTRDKKHINGTDTVLSHVVEASDEGTFVAGYGIPDHLRQALSERGATVYDGAEDEDFLRENAKITAHGTLGRILTETERDVSELTVGIIGYGRIGSALAELLLFLGAEVKVYSESLEKIALLAEAGARVEMACDWADFSGLDILINTAPKAILSPHRVGEIIDSGTLLIELASGKNFSDSRVVSMPSIPDRMYPLSAGRLYARAIAEAVMQRKNGG